MVEELIPPTHQIVLSYAIIRIFYAYWKGSKQVTQLMPSVVWKQVYVDYLVKYPTPLFMEDTLLDLL